MLSDPELTALLDQAARNLDTLELLGSLPEQMSVHLDGGYDSQTTREKLKSRGLEPMISEKGKPAPLRSTKRWVVERTFAWLSQNRRMSKDYDRLCSTSESFVYAAMARLMVKRLASI